MEHVVFYPSADGSPAFRRVGSLDEAVNFVEHLRNVEGISDFSVHALTAVPLSFRAYYHVEVPADGPAEAHVEITAPVPVEVPAQAEAVAPEPVEAPAPVDVPAGPFTQAPPAEPVAEAAPVIDEAPSAPPIEAAAEDAPVEAAGVEDTGVEDTWVEDAAQPVVDPSVEDVVPVPSGRRSMGFFARS